MNNQLQVNINSEIGELEGVILHTPGVELQNMTPQTAKRALYSDILNLAVASKEYSQLKGVLDKVAKTFEVKDLLSDVLADEKVKIDVVNKVCTNENAIEIRDYLISLSNIELTKQLFEGVVMRKNSLTKFLSKDKYSLQPLHNFFFTRDSSIAIKDRVLIGRMANRVRKREALIMESIFDNHKSFVTKTVNPESCYDCHPELTVEGGDVLIVRDDILLIGIGARTTSQGIDFIIDKLKEKDIKRNVIIQELPLTPESFIHLDMVFTMLDKDKCMVYEPIILKPNKYRTIHVVIEGGEVKSIEDEKNIPDILSKLGMDLKPILCGGNDAWVQEREQWHSGANFFAIAPGRVIGYGRNVYTMDEMNKNGFEIIPAKEIIRGKVSLNDYEKYVISIEGSELSRGGGGARCMTMPVRRKDISW
ncbi:MAG: arginine deiminase [Bacteroidales bacterium]|nr:arginine deiminase [Bacteroidales bacterium]MBN2757030.1 arginine deiminase [Bacteroidales bacterium]